MTSTEAPQVRGNAEAAQKGAFQGSAILASGKFIAIAFNVGLHVLLVRSLPQEDFGALAYALAAVNVLAIVVSLGMEQTVSRFAAMYDERREVDKLSGLILFYVLVVGGLGALVCGVLIGFPGAVQSVGRVDASVASVLAALCLMGPLQAADTMLMNVFATFAQPMAVFWRRYFVAPGLKIAVVLIVLATTGSVVHIALGYVIGTALAIAVYLPFAVAMLRRAGAFSAGSGITFDVRGWLGFTMAGLASDLLVVILFFSDVFMVGLLGTERDVALLQAVQPIANGALVVFYALIPIFLPSVTRLFENGDTERAQQTFARCTVWIIVITLPVATMTVGYAAQSNALLFSAEYAESGPIMAAAAGSQYLIAIFGLTGLLLKAQGKLWKLSAANAVIAVFNIGLNVALIYRYGPLGAALGTLVAVVALSAVKTSLVKSQLGIQPVTGPVIRAALTAALVLAVSAVVSVVFDPHFVTALVISAALCLVAVRVNRHGMGMGEVFPALGKVPMLRPFL